MLVEFTTNSTGNASGFYAEYSSVSPSWCQGLQQMTESSGTFNDGSGNFYYQSQATCMWRINPPDANTITLNFNYFDTEEGFDKISVYDGTSLIGVYSGNQIPEEIIATSGMMFITWNTNQANNFQGWEAYYEVDNVGVEEGSVINGLQVYPNPADNNLNISFSSEQKQNVEISLSNLTGQTILAMEYPLYSGYFKEVISLNEIPAGVYFLKINSLQGIETRKIVVR